MLGGLSFKTILTAVRQALTVIASTGLPSLIVTGSVALGATSTGALTASSATITGSLDLSGASAGQIVFPATQNASAGANTLDDYEEGTWTPSVGGSATYTSQSGTYTKIGRVVEVNFLMALNLIGTGSASRISGLPFTIGSVNSALAIGHFGYVTNVASTYCLVNAGTGNLVLESLTAVAAGTTEVSVLGNNAFIHAGGVYNV